MGEGRVSAVPYVTKATRTYQGANYEVLERTEIRSSRAY